MRWWVVALGVTACARQAPPDETDPLVQKLLAEKARVARGGQPGGPPTGGGPNDQLAELTQQPPDVPISLPVRTHSLTRGAITATPRKLETAQIVAGPKLKLSTTDRFVRVVVRVSTTEQVTLDLSQAVLARGTQTWPLARDVQRVGQGSPLAATLASGVAQDLVLYFELPADSVQAGLSLRLEALELRLLE